MLQQSSFNSFALRTALLEEAPSGLGSGTTATGESTVLDKLAAVLGEKVAAVNESASLSAQRGLINALDLSTAILGYADTINREAQMNSGRDIQLSAAITHLLALFLHQKITQAAENRTVHILGRGEDNFLTAYLGSHQDVPVPDWYGVASPYIQMVNGGNHLPQMPHCYFGASDQLRSYSADFLQELDNTVSNISRLNSAPGNVAKELDLLERRLYQILQTLGSALKKSSDIYPETIPEVLQSATIEVGVTPQTLLAIIEVYKQTAQVLETYFLGETAEVALPNKLSLIGAENLEVGSGPSTLKIGQLKDTEIAAILAAFVKLRDGLVHLAPAWRAQHQSKSDEIVRESVQALGNALLKTIPINNTERHTQVIVKMLESPNKDIYLQALEIVAQPCFGLSANGHYETVYLLKDANNCELLLPLTRILINTAEKHPGLVSALRSSGLGYFVTVTDKIRNFLGDGKLPGLSNELETLITACLADNAKDGSQKSLAVILSLYCLLEKKEWRAAIRGKMAAHSDDLQTLVSNLTAKASPLQKNLLRQIASSIRLGLRRRLEDHYGYSKLKSQLITLINRYQKFLLNPGAWMDMPELQVLENGLLFHGGTGSGKTSLVECLAAEFDVDIDKVNRGKMEGATNGQSANADATKVVVTTRSFCDYLAKEVKKSDDKRRQAGKLFAFVLVDEIDADISKKNGDSTAGANAKDTNAMLTTIETLRKDYPNIIVAFTTNHIERCEDAAIRDGRIGKVFETPVPTAEDISAIVKGRMLDLGLTKSLEALDKKLHEIDAEGSSIILASIKDYPNAQSVTQDSTLGDALKFVCSDLIAQTIITAINQIEVERRIAGDEDSHAIGLKVMERIIEARKTVKVFDKGI